MLPIACALAIALFPSGVLSPQVAAAQPIAAHAPAAVTPALNDKVLKALDAWLKLYRRGKIDFSSNSDIVKTSMLKKHGVLPKGLLGKVTYQRELEILCEQAVEMNTDDAAQRVLEVASIGLDRAKYTRKMAPHLVRDVGEHWIVKFSAAEAKDFVLKVARGEKKLGSRDRATGARAAALRALGSFGDAAFRPTMEGQLGDTNPQVRLAAAEGLQKLGAEASIEPLARSLGQEQDDLAIEAMVIALRACLTKAVGEDKDVSEGEAALPESSRLAVRAAIGALGRTSWRADMTLVSFLKDFRSIETIPALIAILEKFEENPDDVRSGKLSGLLLYRAHETLVSLTGAVFPADEPAQWRGFWENERATIKLAARKAETEKPGTVSKGFFGIPVQGTRVVFILDLSGSMNEPMRRGTASRSDSGERSSRLDYAKKELLRAVDGLPEVSSFNLITFFGAGARGAQPKVEKWSKDLTPASPKMKEKFIKHVEGVTAFGGTNLWGGLQEALKMKSLVYGDRYETEVDEIFLLSDGAPTIGEVVDPVEILRLVTETNRFSKVRINTVFISSPSERNPSNVSLSPSELMKRMAAQNGGKFVEL